MNVKELKSRARELRNEAANLEQLFKNAVVSYLNTIVGVASCKSYDTNGKACLEEILTSYNSGNDLITIKYVIMDEYGDLTEIKTVQVSSSEIDKYILV